MVGSRQPFTCIIITTLPNREVPSQRHFPLSFTFHPFSNNWSVTTIQLSPSLLLNISISSLLRFGFLCHLNTQRNFQIQCLLLFLCFEMQTD